MGDFGAYVKRYICKQREKLESQIAALDAKIEQERDVMADMFKEQKLMKLSTGNGQSVGKKKMN